ncbi:MAG: hypothetical protein KDC83_00890 [Flavobacteriales bacterium]|nr:hypothetical protein [Flavobacteriales bacterium]
MIRLWIVLALVAILITGLITIVLEIKDYVGKSDFLIEFRNKYSELCKGLTSSYNGIMASVNKLDNKVYTWLTSHVNKAQRLMGIHGVLGSYIPPFGKVQIRNYEILINTLPQFRNGKLHPHDISGMDDALIRGIGHYEELIELLKKDLKNPFKWLQYGVRFYISLPLRILQWFGILPESSFYFLTHNFIFKLFAGVASLIGVIASIVGLVTDSVPFLEIVKKWI